VHGRWGLKKRPRAAMELWRILEWTKIRSLGYSTEQPREKELVHT
jgi:hypothetical protein